jgi:replication factor C subunit 1
LTEDGLFDMVRKSKPAKAPANKHDNNSNSEKLQKSQTKSSPVKVEKRAVEQVSTMDKSIASKSEIASTNNQKAKVVDRGSLQWTEKYRPKVPNDIVGNQSMVKQLHDWLKSWEEQFLHPGQKGKGKKQTDGGAKKAVLLSGPPGIGKTTTAKVVSQMLGLQAIEVNASDSRGKADSKIEKGVGGSTSNSIKELISNATLNYSDNRTKKPKAVLIMDEVDGMSAGDRGGVADLIASIKISKIPIVCICNDRFSQKLKSLVNYCLLLNFRKPTKQQVISCHIRINNDLCKVLLVFLLLSITLLLPLLLTLTTDMLFSLLSCLQYLGRDVISVLLLILSHTNRLFNLVFLNIRKHGYLM